MKYLHGNIFDFEAKIKIYTKEQGGRDTPAFNGIRWDFAYADEDMLNQLYMIHPDFYDEKENSISKEIPLPTNKELSARMLIIASDMKEKVHRKHISIGTKFFCHEGGKRVAEGHITKITGLFD